MKNPRVAIVSCIFGDYDIPHEPFEQNFAGQVDFYCFTDAHCFKKFSQTQSKWQIKLLDESLASGVPEVHRSLYNAFFVKTQPFTLFPNQEYDHIILVDANMQITINYFVTKMLTNGTVGDTLRFAPNYQRTNIAEEVCASKTIKYKNTDLDAQLQSYRDRGMPVEECPLLWNGLCVFLDPFGESTKEFGKMYMDEGFRWCIDETRRFHIQGQVVLPFVLWKLKDQLQVGDLGPFGCLGLTKHEHLVPPSAWHKF